MAILSYIKEYSIDIYYNRFNFIFGIILYIVLFIQEKKCGTKNDDA